MLRSQKQNGGSMRTRVRARTGAPSLSMGTFKRGAGCQSTLGGGSRPRNLRRPRDRGGRRVTWKAYPWTAPWGDPAWFTFPACDGDARRLGVQTYFVDGFLRGARTGTQYAFLTVFTDARVVQRTQRFSFFSLALFDCDRRRYGTSTDFD